MERRDFLIRSAVGMGTILAENSARAEGLAGAPRRPNILWVFGDQHRAQALSCAGDANLKTPAIDALAGGVARSAVAGCPLCTPFRGALLTSQYPHQCAPGHDYALPEGMPMVASAFHDAGYRTAYFGKWHVDGHENRKPKEAPVKQIVRPERRGGFEAWLGYENNNAQYDCWVHGHDAAGASIERYKLPGYETDSLTDLLIAYLDDRGREQSAGHARPFFAALSVQPPHSPYVAPEEWTARHRADSVQLRPNVPNVRRIQDDARRDLAGYYAMIENLDWNVGRIVDALKRTNLLEDTYIVFFSDHGDMHGSHARILKCVPWEESIRIPFIVAKGGKPCASAPGAALLNHVDIAPTTLGLCGIAVPEWMRGRDLSGLVDPTVGRAASAPDSAFLQLVDPGFKYGFASDRERPWRGVVTLDGWKYATLEGQPWLLYDLNEDPYELANHALDGRFKTQRRKLQDRLAAWIADTGDTFTLPTLAT